jgi:predicted TIM-barrel fold metal-dependent hydrolase
MKASAPLTVSPEDATVGRIVDVHMHVYESKAQGARNKMNYQIWEYGEKPDQRFSKYGGDLEDAESAMAEAGYDHAVVVHLWATARARDAAINAIPAHVQGEARRKAIAEIDANNAESFKASNRWVTDLLAGNRKFTAFVSADPWALPPDEGVEHLRDMVENRGAKGIKLHPVLQDFDLDDERMHPIYRACLDLGITVLTHTGPGKLGQEYAEPRAAAAMLRRFPELPVIFAHMGGGAWKQTLELAQSFPNALFDCCEIIAWIGGTNAPSRGEFAKLIKDIGPARVLLGTDFPWYDLDRTVNEVLDLPRLSQEEKDGILGENAIRALKLQV